MQISEKHMAKIIVSEWISLDGVFDAGTMDQWYNAYHTDERGEYIKEGILSAGAFLLGRTTYEMLWPYWSSQKNNEMGVADKLNKGHKYVVSSTLKKAEWSNSTIIDKSPLDAIVALKKQVTGDLFIMGSSILVQSLMAAKLIDEYRFLVHPNIMGNGRRFFREEMPVAHLELVKTQTFGLGVLQLTYRPGSLPK